MNIYKCGDGRLRCYVNGKVMSYPKYLMEQQLGRELTDTETVDHIDGNPLNNELCNLRILTRAENARLGAIGNKHALGYKQKEEEKRSGQFNGMAKLLKFQVDEYRKQYEAGELSKKEIITKTGMTRKAVENFLNYVSYK